MTSMMKGCVMALLLVTGAAQAGHSPQEARNKQNVLEFYRQGLNNKDFAAARPFLPSMLSTVAPRRMSTPRARCSPS